MASLKVTFPDGDPRIQLKKAQRIILEGTIDGFEETAAAIKRRAQQNLTELGRVNTGSTRASIDYKVEGRRLHGQYGHLVGTAIRAEVFVGAQQGIWIEKGRRGLQTDPTKGDPLAAKAAWPNANAIAQWVLDKWSDLAPAGRTKSGKARRIVDMMSRIKIAKSLAFVIGRKIARFGIAPSPFLLPAFHEFAPSLPSAIKRHIQRRKSK
jgi:hypothetical protein